jgi:vacuolar-type H+-ATPase subunit H
MKQLETLKELYPKVNSLLGEIDAELNDAIKKSKKETQDKILEAKIKLLEQISEGEDLKLTDLINKYLNDKEKKGLKSNEKTIDVKTEDLLDTIEVNGKTFYYENKDKGQVFDNKSKQVGIYKDGKIVFTKDD